MDIFWKGMSTLYYCCGTLTPFGIALISCASKVFVFFQKVFLSRQRIVLKRNER